MTSTHPGPPEGNARSVTSGETPVSRPAPVRSVHRRLLIAALVLVGGAAVWLFAGAWKKDARDALPPEDPTASTGPRRLMVTAEPVVFRPVQRVVEATGTLHGFEEIVISAKVEGRVLRIHREVADRVPPDELLAEIDPTDYRFAVDQAEGNLRVELAKLGLQEPPDAGSFDHSKVPTVMLAQARVDRTRSSMERTKRLAAEN